MVHGDIVKLVVSALLGLILGLEREVKRKPLGLKTCLVISTTSCLLTIVGIDSSLHFNSFGGDLRLDPMRVTAQIVSGIGFLGAGVILRRNNEVVSGLTTAAIVWASAGLGIAVGAGFYADAVVGMLILVLSVEGIPFVLKRMGPRTLREKELAITIVYHADVSLDEIVRQVDVAKVKIKRIKTRQDDTSTREARLLCVVDRVEKTTNVFDSVAAVPGVMDVLLETL
jgi:putative Mg2+ transporter-C (MgtC) family protein